MIICVNFCPNLSTLFRSGYENSTVPKAVRVGSYFLVGAIRVSYPIWGHIFWLPKSVAHDKPTHVYTGHKVFGAGCVSKRPHTSTPKKCCALSPPLSNPRVHSTAPKVSGTGSLLSTSASCDPFPQGNLIVPLRMGMRPLTIPLSICYLKSIFDNVESRILRQ